MGSGHYVPTKVVTNDDLAQIMPTTDEWIHQRTGIRERRFIEESGIGASDLAIPAAKMAVEQAGREIKDIDAVLFATLSPDHQFPGAGCLLIHKLGLPGVPALDVRNQCSGFLYSLSVADAWIRCGMYRNVLVVGSEVHSTGVEFTERGRDVAVLFGDGAGAVLVGDGRQRKAAIVELAPRDKDERKPRGEDEPAIHATNHLLREPFERDAQNDRIRRYTSSGYRYERLGELLAGPGPVDPARAVAILRDRRGLGGEELGLGNRNALDNLHLTHSVVVDATAMVLWVAEGPSALGRYRAIDLRHALTREGARPAPLDDFPADRLLYSEEYGDYKEALAAIDHARVLLAQGLPRKALADAQVALALAPDVGDLHRLLGDIERELGNLAAARTHYERYLELVPGRLRDQERVRGLLEELGV